MQLDFRAGPFTQATLGPAAEIRLRGDGAYVAGRRVATFAAGFWTIGGTAFTRANCPTPVLAHGASAAGRSPDEGPYAALRVTDGAVWHDDRLLWRLDADGRWKRAGATERWDELVLRDPP